VKPRGTKGSGPSPAALEGVVAEIHTLTTKLDVVDEKLSLLLAESGFYAPEQVQQLSTLSATEIGRRQAEGRFPSYIHLGANKRAMPRAWLHRWTYLVARGREWSAAEVDLLQLERRALGVLDAEPEVDERARRAAS